MMAANLVPLAIAGVNTAGNLIGNMVANQHNLDIMHEQQRWSEQMWQKQNAYNSPMAQMSRLREAGINPALAYAQGGIENTADSQAQSAESARMIPYRMDLDPNMIAQGELMQAQAENLRADSQLKLSQVPEAEQRIAESKQRMSNMLQEILESAARIRNLDVDTLKKSTEEAHIRWQETFDSQRWKDEREKILADIRLSNSSASINEQQLTEMLETLALRVYGMRLSNTLTEKKIAEAEKNLELLGLQITAEGQLVRMNEPRALSADDITEAQLKSSFWRSGTSLLSMLRFIILGK